MSSSKTETSQARLFLTEKPPDILTKKFTSRPLRKLSSINRVTQFPFRTEFSFGSLLRRYRWSLLCHRRFLRSYLRSLWRSAAVQSAMPIFAWHTKHCKMLNIVKHHETLVKHCDTSWNIVKHREPLAKHREQLVKHHEPVRTTSKTSWNILKTLWNITKHSPFNYYYYY